MPEHDDHRKIARVMLSRGLAVAERWLRPADQLDYMVRRWLIPIMVRRWLIPVPLEGGTRSMPHKEASMRSGAALSPVQAAIGRHLRAEYAIERSMSARLANLLREFEQRNNNPEAIARTDYASAA
jgi:hypothetical protein